MIVEYAHAIFMDKQEIAVLQFNNIHICADIRNGMGYLIYRQEQYLNDLIACGFHVTESSMHLDIDEDSFHDLEFSWYEAFNCDIYQFTGLAVKAGEEGLEIISEPDLSIEEIAFQWHLEMDDLTLNARYAVPKGEIGNLATEMEQVDYDYSSFLKEPLETHISEGRLESASEYAAMLSDRAGYYKSSELADRLKEHINGAEQNPHPSAHDVGMIRKAKWILERAMALEYASKRLIGLYYE